VDNKLECGLQAYADSVEAGVTRSFRQRLGSWPVYAAAAGSALALSTSAMASTIIFSGPLSPGTETVNITSHGKFSVSDPFIINPPTDRGRAVLNGSGIATTKGRSVFAFSNGTKAFEATGFHGNGKHLLRFATNTGSGVRHSGLWPSNGTEYAAIKLANGDQGWLKIEVESASYGVPNSVDILAYAYEEATPPSTVPEPNSLALALLATGSVGVLAFRRRRKAAASQGA